MHHIDPWDSTAALLSVGVAPAGRESAWAQALAFIEAGHGDNVHLVASVLVVAADGRVLLARHRRYGQWGPLGGHYRSDDASLSAAAARELLEESAVVAHVHPAPIDVGLSFYRCRTTNEPVQHLDTVFVARAAETTPALVASDELTGLGWFHEGDLPRPLLSVTTELVGFAIAAAHLRGDLSSFET
jgi:8-oxo-dGTP pyrophosphatase MutT (NUDIX family)